MLSVEYAYADEMDELLQFAHQSRGNTTIANTLLFTLQGEKPQHTLPPPRDSVQTTTLPAPIAALLSVKENVENVLNTLQKLVKENKIIAGSAKDFETTDGLYGCIVGKEGIIALIKAEKQQYFDAESGNAVQLKTYAGKRIICLKY